MGPSSRVVLVVVGRYPKILTTAENILTFMAETRYNGSGISVRETLRV